MSTIIATSTYSPPELLRMWARSELTVEQAIGHILQHLAALSNHRAGAEKPQSITPNQVGQPPSTTE